LGTFTFNSSQGNNNLLISYTQQATKDNPGQPDDDTRDAGLGNVVGPSAVPEPASLLLCGTALSLLGFAFRRRAA
jgi:hypothetical protein